MLYRKKGFTLIELLVVLAIVGVLVAISIFYMTQSKDKGSDAGVRTNVINARGQAEVYYTNAPRSYLGVCNNTATGIFKHVQAAKRAYGGVPQVSYANGSASTWQTEQCHDAVNTYVVWSPLRSSTSASPRGLCVDSENTTKISTSVLLANATRCP